VTRARRACLTLARLPAHRTIQFSKSPRPASRGDKKGHRDDVLVIGSKNIPEEPSGAIGHLYLASPPRTQIPILLLPLYRRPEILSTAKLYETQACQYQMQFPGWARGFHIWLNKPPACALRPV